VFSGKIDGNYAERLPLTFLVQYTNTDTVFFICCNHFVCEISERKY
jgi:hypothetical protein